MSISDDKKELVNSSTLDCTLKECIDHFQRPDYHRRNSSISTIGNRLSKRRELHIKRKILSDLSLGFAVIGLVVMIIHLEMKFAKIRIMSFSGLFMQVLLSILTTILLALIVIYHITDMRVFMIDNTLTDFRVGFGFSRFSQVIIEIIICSIHPFFYFVYPNDYTKLLDNLFGLMMFMRFYLLGRVLVLHSWINQSLWTQSLGTMNRINFNFRFVLKSAMNLYPVSIISLMVVILYFWSSWAVRVCEIHHKNGTYRMRESMWLVAITFLGVGYGDIVPITTCGRVVAVLTGIFGTGITALTVAILAKKLEFSHSESYVHYFVMTSKLNKSLRIAAANIVKRAWRLYKVKAINHASKFNYCYKKDESVLYCERKLFQSLFITRDIKRRLKQVNDESVGIDDTKKIHQNLQGSIYDLRDRIVSIENTVNELNINLNTFLSNKSLKIVKL